MKEPEFRLPNDIHIFRMTDSTGMLQHAKYGVPDPTHGYTADDNARALIMAAMLFEAANNNRYLDLAFRYLGFLLYARNGAWFRNYMDYDRHFKEDRGSQDCFGRCIWALGFTASRQRLPVGIRQAAEFLLQQTIAGCDELTASRSQAYALIGLHHWNDGQSRDLLLKLASDLSSTYRYTSGKDWKWFDERLTYCNAVMPWAMLSAYEATQEKRYQDIGFESLDFLLSVTFKNNLFQPVGCNGWFLKGQTAARFDEQPVEACETLLACLKAYDLSGKDIYRNRARQCLEWYTGQNSQGISLIDPDTGGCMDGLTPHGPNRNEGAESLVSWMIAFLAWAGKSAGKPG